ncbi:MAG: GDP-6-deoxy-D-mannose reductase [Candidatus Anoxychlamydiales bacterium]|nr:GDP-6-deoxy-D-mannose reductase [Candidatus Anoxychlamydiales bacterium]
MKKVAFITGISGMVGSHLSDYLLENTNWDIHGLIRWRSPLDNISHLINQINNQDRVFLSYGDINDSISLLSILKKIKPDYVFHLAAQSYPLTSFESPLDTYNTNVIGTAKLLEALRAVKIDPIIHVCASSEVFGRVSKEKLPIKEDCTFHPASPYAISKVGTDLIGRYHAEAYGQKVITTRMFTHTGPRRGDVFAESSFAKQIAMIENDLIPPIIKVGNLNSLRTFADVRDAVRAYYMLVTINPTPGEYYNIGGDYVCTIKEMLNSLLKMSTVRNIQVQVDPIRLRPIDADLQIPDITKFSNHTGWKPQISFQKTMEDLLNYWRDKIAKGNLVLQR